MKDDAFSSDTQHTVVSHGDHGDKVDLVVESTPNESLPQQEASIEELPSQWKSKMATLPSEESELGKGTKNKYQFVTPTRRHHPWEISSNAKKPHKDDDTVVDDTVSTPEPTVPLTNAKQQLGIYSYTQKNTTNKNNSRQEIDRTKNKEGGPRFMNISCRNCLTKVLRLEQETIEEDFSSKIIRQGIESARLQSKNFASKSSYDFDPPIRSKMPHPTFNLDDCAFADAPLPRRTTLNRHIVEAGCESSSSDILHSVSELSGPIQSIVDATWDDLPPTSKVINAEYLARPLETFARRRSVEAHFKSRIEKLLLDTISVDGESVFSLSDVLPARLVRLLPHRLQETRKAGQRLSSQIHASDSVSSDSPSQSLSSQVVPEALEEPATVEEVLDKFMTMDFSNVNYYDSRIPDDASIPALSPYGKLAPTTDHDSDDETALDSNALRSFLDDLLHEREFNKEIELALQRSDAALQLVQLFHWSEK